MGRRLTLGLDALVPQYPKDLLVPEDTTYWEVLYQDGTFARETDGKSLTHTPREGMASFRLIHGGELLIEVPVPAGMTGKNLIYRRRTSMVNGDRDVCFVFGWVPGGPAFAFDVTKMAYRVSEEGFIMGDPQLSPPVLTPQEEEYLEAFDTSGLHRADAVVVRG